MRTKKNSVEAYRGSLSSGVEEEGEVGTAVAPAEPVVPVLSKVTDRLRDLDIVSIIPDPDQARKVFEGIEELAESIRQKGVITPLIVSKLPSGNDSQPDCFKLIAGERRWRAASLAGLKRVPCIIKTVTDPDEIAFIENVHRRDLKYVEQCLYIKSIIERKGYKQREFAERVVMPESSVSEAIKTASFADKYVEKFGSLDPLLKASTAAGRPLGASHFRQVIAQPSFQEQTELLNKIMKDSLTIKKIKEATNRSSRVQRPWDSAKLTRHFKSLRKNIDLDILRKVDDALVTPEIIAELKQTHQHLTSYVELLSDKIRSVKG